MILVFSIVFLVLVLTTWIYSVYVLWKIEQGAPLSPIQATPFVARWHMGLRLARRGWFNTGRYLNRCAAWIQEKARVAFVAVFPKSATIFVTRDKLTGLTHGPSSYFLKTISPQPRKAATRRLPRTKKVL